MCTWEDMAHVLHIASGVLPQFVYCLHWQCIRKARRYIEAGKRLAIASRSCNVLHVLQ